MSFEAMTWAIKQPLPTHEKFVLLMMANYASNDRGDCYPSIGTLAGNTGLSKDSVMRAIKALEKRGLLDVVRRKQEGVNLPNVYRLQLNLIVATSDHPPGTAAKVVAVSDSNQSFNQSINKKVGACARESIDFDFQAGAFIGIAALQQSSWKAAYPATDVDCEVLRAASWLMANPANRKGNYVRFLTNWLSRAQDKAGRVATTDGARGSARRSVNDQREDWLEGLGIARPRRRPTAAEQREDWLARFRNTPAAPDDLEFIDVPATPIPVNN